MPDEYAEEWEATAPDSIQDFIDKAKQEQADAEAFAQTAQKIIAAMQKYGVKTFGELREALRRERGTNV